MSQPLVHTVITARKGWQMIDLKEIREYRDLLFFMVYRDVTVIYKQTVLGFAWAILNPLFTMVVFNVIFGNLLNVDSNGIPKPVFFFSALVPWTYFSSSLTMSTNSLISATNIIGKVYFPRLIIPLTPVFSKLVDFAIAMLVLFVLMAIYQVAPTWDILFLPLLVLLMVLTASGIGMWLSSLAIQYRDIKFAVGFLVQVLQYAAPVVWSISLLPEKYRLLYGIYPLGGVIAGFRSAIVGGAPMPWDLILVGTISSILIFVSGAFYFRRMERSFADVA